ncbi:MAG: restriction endonuclease subunit S [Chloroflexota bacterium]
MAEARPATLTREDRRQQFIESGWWVSIPLTTVPVHWVYQGENRLDANYYAQESQLASRIVVDSGYPSRQLGEVAANIWYPSRFKRILSNANDGVPFIGATELVHLRPEVKYYISSNSTADVNSLIAKENSLYITRSGTVGRISLFSKRLKGKALSEHIIRLDISQFPGYVYAFLSSSIGQALISRSVFGSSVSEIEPHHLAGIPVPLLPEETQAEIHAEIMRAYALRDEANTLLDEADELLHQKLGLPRFDESLVPYLPPPTTPRLPASRPEMPHPKVFSIRASDLENRFDASYHVPVARTVISLLNQGEYKPIHLGQIAAKIFIPPRFKRIYVPKEYGIPFLQGSHLPQMRPYDLKYISIKANAKHIDECIIVPGYVLVTRSGTIGRVGLVSSAQDRWTASEHLLRIVPKEEQGHPGYIAAFLMTPYGQHQLTAKIYGGVVDELTEEDTRAVWIPNAPLEIQKEIGTRVGQAYEKKDQASVIEEKAIKRLEEYLTQR